MPLNAEPYMTFFSVILAPLINGAQPYSRAKICLTASDVTKLFKILIRRMQISASNIRQIRMRMSLDKGLFYHSECNTLVYVK